jgi:hypothetical protein
MTYGVTPFAVSLTQIRKATGSRSKSILRDLREEFEDELAEDREQVEEANEDDEFDPELSLERALRHLILDEERWDYEGPKYGYAVELICSFYGEILPNDHWTGISLSWAETINDSLLETGVSADTFSIFGHLFYRGSPVEIPEIDDFPCIGYVTLSEIPDALASLSDKQLSLIKGDDVEEIRVALVQVRDWLETCQRDKSDLVCFYY